MSRASDIFRGVRGEGRRLNREPLPTRSQSEGQTGTSSAVDKSETETVANGEAGAVMHVESGQPMANDDPLRRRITRRSSNSLLSRLFTKRELTPEEKDLLEERKKRAEMEMLLRSESMLFMERIKNALDRRELCYRFRKSEKDFFVSGVQSVRFDCVVMQPDAIYLRVDTRHLPRGVGILQLVDEDILTDLSLACQHRVTASWDERVGCWYIIERASGVLGIPGHVKLTDLLTKFPASADGLALPIGLGSNARPVYRSLGQMYSMLVAGTIGAGKSNIINVFLCTLIRRNPPDRLKLMLVDLKGGLEFSFYEGIPHLLPIEGVAEKGIAYFRNQVPELLRWLLKEGERRIQVIKNAGHKDIGRYNQRNRKAYMPHLVLVIDEWADIKLEGKIGREAEDLLTNIAQRFRAVGIHVIICTQVPKSEIISTRIKGVLPAKVAFSCPTNQASMAILDNGHAKGLEPVGRAILQWYDEIQVQTPYITDQFIKETVDGAIAGKFEKVTTVTHDVTELELFQWALNNDNGALTRERLYAAFRGRGITKVELVEMIRANMDKEIVIGSSIYRIDPGDGRRPNRLISIDVQRDDEEPANEVH